MFQPAVTILSTKGADTVSRDAIVEHLPACSPRLILIKPNWVRHAENPAFPVEALVTDSRLIEAVIEACLRNYPAAEEIIVGDVPLQDCDWPRLCQQSGITALQSRYESHRNPTVRFLDLRRECFVSRDGFLSPVPGGNHGDPYGYREVSLDSGSFLDEISDAHKRFGVSDFDRDRIRQSHRPGLHRYLVASCALEADLVINLAKMKTHQKAGITGALKNLVGINGEKAYLVHYRRGTPGQSGDEFAPDTPLSVRLQVRVRECLQKRWGLAYRLLGKAWRVYRRRANIATEGTPDQLAGTAFYLAGGAWYGNDTIWRMIYDLNRIIRYADREGTFRKSPQREYLAICDGGVAGEGNGPLQPLPVNTGVLLFSRDPFAMDLVMARLMGFDYRRIAQLANHARYGEADWGAFDTDALAIDMDGVRHTGVDALPVLHRFRPPPGWAGHIEGQDPT